MLRALYFYILTITVCSTIVIYVVATAPRCNPHSAKGPTIGHALKLGGC